MSDDDHDDDGVVKVRANNEKVYLHPGRYDVATLKKLARIPQAEDLDELVECKLRPVPDDATIEIKGSEIFISHVKDGGSA